MTAIALQDAARGRPSPATPPSYHGGRPPRNKGLRYPADPPSVEEIVAVMRQADTTTQGLRARALTVVEAPFAYHQVAGGDDLVDAPGGFHRPLGFGPEPRHMLG